MGFLEGGESGGESGEWESYWGVEGEWFLGFFCC